MLKQAVLLMCFVNVLVMEVSSENEPSTLDKSLLEEALEEVVLEESLPKEVSEGSDVIDKKDNLEESQREKRYFDYGFNTGLPSWSSAIPPNYQSYVKRDNSQNFGYGTSTINEGALTFIQRKLQDIANSARRQYLPPDPPRPTIPIPTFIPYRIYIPRIECGCGINPEIQPPRRPSTSSPTPPTQPPQTPNFSDGGITNPSQESTPDLSTRIDATDETSENNLNPAVDDNDGVRPISFDPIRPKRPITFKVPEVEHGSFQAGAQPDNKPVADSNQYPLQQAPQSTIGSDAPIAPTDCEMATLRCCIKSPQAKQCSMLEGCFDSSTYQNSCNPQYLLTILNKLSKYHKNKPGY